MQVIKELGRGGYGVVEKVIDVDGNFYARKTFHIMHPGSLDEDEKKEVLSRFKREVNKQIEIDHKNVVKVLRADLNSNPPYYLMPLAESSLDDDLHADDTLGGRYLEVMLDILAGLEEMHELGLAHRDLKPRNILRYKNSDNTDYYAIGDFGFVTTQDSQVSMITKTGVGLQGDSYISPEVSKSLRDSGTPADIYSAGCILHALVGTSRRYDTLEIDDSGPYGHLMAICTRPDPKRRPTVSSFRESLLAISQQNTLAAAISRNDIIAKLASGDKLDITSWVRLGNFLSNQADSAASTHPEDFNTTLRLLNLDRIDEIKLLDEELFLKIGKIFAKWTRESGFPFEFCDVLANRLSSLISSGDINLKTECIMSLLYLGTKHNRFYVEREFLRQTGYSMETRLAQRIAMEFNIDGQLACEAIRHLENSLTWQRSQLHPLLATKLTQICK